MKGYIHVNRYFILFGIGIGLFIFSFFLAQNEGLAYKTISRGFSALFVSLGILALMGYLINFISSHYLNI